MIPNDIITESTIFHLVLRAHHTEQYWVERRPGRPSHKAVSREETRKINSRVHRWREFLIARLRGVCTEVEGRETDQGLPHQKLKNVGKITIPRFIFPFFLWSPWRGDNQI